MASTKVLGPASVGRYFQDTLRHPNREYGYARLLGLRTFDPARLHARVEEGLSFEAFERLRSVLDVPMSRLAELVRIPSRTVVRRKEAKRLTPDESDRLLRLSRVVGRALQLFEGELGAARAWLTKEQPALGFMSPLDFATSEVGAREVDNLIGRLEHGIPL